MGYCAGWQLRRALRPVVRGFGLKDSQPRCRSKDQFRRASNGQCEQPNHSDYKDCERYGIIVKPMVPLCVHDLKPSHERLTDSRPNAAKPVTCVTGKWPTFSGRPVQQASRQELDTMRPSAVPIPRSDVFLLGFVSDSPGTGTPSSPNADSVQSRARLRKCFRCSSVRALSAHRRQSRAYV